MLRLMMMMMKMMVASINCLLWYSCCYSDDTYPGYPATTADFFTDSNRDSGPSLGCVGLGLPQDPSHRNAEELVISCLGLA